MIDNIILMFSSEYHILCLKNINNELINLYFAFIDNILAEGKLFLALKHFIETQLVKDKKTICFR